MLKLNYLLEWSQHVIVSAMTVQWVVQLDMALVKVHKAIFMQGLSAEQFASSPLC